MLSYQNKIKTIQETIKDIKNDLDSIKGVKNLFLFIFSFFK